MKFIFFQNAIWHISHKFLLELIQKFSRKLSDYFFDSSLRTLAQNRQEINREVPRTIFLEVPTKISKNLIKISPGYPPPVFPVILYCNCFWFFLSKVPPEFSPKVATKIFQKILQEFLQKILMTFHKFIWEFKSQSENFLQKLKTPWAYSKIRKEIFQKFLGKLPPKITARVPSRIIRKFSES